MEESVFRATIKRVGDLSVRVFRSSDGSTVLSVGHVFADIAAAFAPPYHLGSQDPPTPLSRPYRIGNSSISGAGQACLQSET